MTIVVPGWFCWTLLAGVGLPVAALAGFWALGEFFKWLDRPSKYGHGLALCALLCAPGVAWMLLR